LKFAQIVVFDNTGSLWTMKIYFAGSIRGGRQYATTYRELIAYIATFSEVLTEHVSDSHLSPVGEEGLSDAQIYARDMNWLATCDALIAEVSAPSLGVGYEIAAAEVAGKPVLCLDDANGDRQLSAMISGSPNVTVRRYKDLAEAKSAIRDFLGRQGS
jgi:nucleoside 2-deoxyribosyltransferase